jgi:hypothetical protein
MIDDLRLAVSELLTVLIEARVGEIDLELSEADGRFRIAVMGPGRLPQLPNQTVDLMARLFGEQPGLAETSWRIEVVIP